MKQLDSEMDTSFGYSDAFLRDTKIVLCCFAMNDAKSIEHVVQFVQEHEYLNTINLLVGCKCELPQQVDLEHVLLNVSPSFNATIITSAKEAIRTMELKQLLFDLVQSQATNLQIATIPNSTDHNYCTIM